MPDPYLVGNGRWCSCCFPEGRPDTRYRGHEWQKAIRPGCNECVGQGRIHFTAEEIVVTTVAEVRAHRERAA